MNPAPALYQGRSAPTPGPDQRPAATSPRPAGVDEGAGSTAMSTPSVAAQVAEVAEIVAGLRRRLAMRHIEVQQIETHISWVLVAGAFAYKIKKPVRLGFLDHSTLAARRAACEAEVRLNRRLAPSLYIGVVPVHAGAHGPVLGGRGAVIEHLVKMHRLPPHALASERLAQGTLQSGQLAALARRLVAFHAAVPAAGAGSPWGRAETARSDALAAHDRLAAVLPTGVAMPPALRRWLEERGAALAPRFEARRRDGHVREGHGDLHLDNVLLLPDGPTAFDCIEFDPALRWIDTMNDLAFLEMDLLAHGRRDLAASFLDAALEAGGDHDGLDVRPYYLVYRALVRALVSALRHRERLAPTALGCADYLDLAERLTAPPAPRLLITHGLPGAGKTWVTQQLLERAGAVRLRSDVERRRLDAAGMLDGTGGRRGPGRSRDRAGHDAHDDPRGRYSATAHRTTYDHLETLADRALAAGCPTIVDAAFLRRAERERMRSLAARRGVPFAILDCVAPPALLRERIAARHARGDDASEADVAVLERLQQLQEPLAAEEREAAITIDTGQPLALAPLLAAWLGRTVASPAATASPQAR